MLDCCCYREKKRLALSEKTIVNLLEYAFDISNHNFDDVQHRWLLFVEDRCILRVALVELVKCIDIDRWDSFADDDVLVLDSNNYVREFQVKEELEVLPVLMVVNRNQAID